KTPGAKRTVAFYAHYDGQPVEPARWATPPWSPVLRDGPLEDGGKPVGLDASPRGAEWRIYARSAGGAKAAAFAFLPPPGALRAAGMPPSVDLKFLLDGEEEAGSPHLPDILRRNREALRADAWVFCDGPVHPSRRPLVYFGARGITDFEMTVYGPLRPLHSG